MDYHCEISEMPAQNTLSVRIHSTKQDLPQAFDRWYSELGKYMVELRQPPAGMPYARYFTMLYCFKLDMSPWACRMSTWHAAKFCPPPSPLPAKLGGGASHWGLARRRSRRANPR
ncbi:MAG: hypothetical protein HZB53_16730 [Chloroflexi bacterium]|nr:hypothetical protein [Chloroflexota bacterium]